MKYSMVTCGECGEQTLFIVCVWPPSFFWCRHCYSVFTYERVQHEDTAVWQLRGYPNSS